MKVVGVVQARLGSTRFPNKVLARITQFESVLSFLLGRLTRSYYLDLIVVATPSKAEAEEMESEQHERDPVPTEFRWYDVPEDDLVARHAAVAREFDADFIVRVPSDNPFVDPFLVDLAIHYAIYGNPGTVYDNLRQRCAGGILDGLGAEVYPRAVIKALDALETTEREHPRAAIALGNYELCEGRDPEWQHGPATFDVNTPADLERLSRLVKLLPPHFNARHLNALPHEVLV